MWWNIFLNACLLAVGLHFIYLLLFYILFSRFYFVSRLLGSRITNAYKVASLIMQKKLFAIFPFHCAWTLNMNTTHSMFLLGFPQEFYFVPKENVQAFHFTESMSSMKVKPTINIQSISLFEPYSLVYVSVWFVFLCHVHVHHSIDWNATPKYLYKISWNCFTRHFVVCSFTLHCFCQV